MKKLMRNLINFFVRRMKKILYIIYMEENKTRPSIPSMDLH
jgi:hypothetical protein